MAGVGWEKNGQRCTPRNLPGKLPGFLWAVLRSGCRAPTWSTLGPPRRGPELARRGGYRRPFGRPPPRATERVRLPCRQAREFADATKPASRFPESDAGRATRVRRALPPPPLAPPRGPHPLSTRAVPAAPLSVTRDTRREGTRAPLLTQRSARRTRRSHNTHSGSSRSSSSLHVIGVDLHTVDTTEQVPGVGGSAKRCYPHTPPPALLAWLRRRHAAPPVPAHTAFLRLPLLPSTASSAGVVAHAPYVSSSKSSSMSVDRYSSNPMAGISSGKRRSSSSANRIPRSVSSKDTYPPLGVLEGRRADDARQLHRRVHVAPRVQDVHVACSAPRRADRRRAQAGRQGCRRASDPQRVRPELARVEPQTQHQVLDGPSHLLHGERPLAALPEGNSGVVACCDSGTGSMSSRCLSARTGSRSVPPPPSTSGTVLVAPGGDGRPQVDLKAASGEGRARSTGRPRGARGSSLLSSHISPVWPVTYVWRAVAQ